MNKKAGGKKRRIVTLEQWVEIRIRDGKTVTTLYPENEAMLERLREMEPQPDLVYRRLNFRDGVPEEYFWVTGNEEKRQWGGHAIQRMKVPRWRQMIASETLEGTGHVLPSGEPMPRPEERGGCDCPTCLAASERLGGVR